MNYIIFFLLLLTPKGMAEVPKSFVDIKSISPDILVDMRYSTTYNITGSIVDGYGSNTCYLKKNVAQKLSLAQDYANKLGYSLKLYDCYRPQKSVDQFYKWHLNSESKMKKAFYPNEVKQELFKKKYFSKKSKHSRGTAIDLTLIKNSNKTEIIFYDSKLENCTKTSLLPKGENSVEMGTAYDCLDELSQTSSKRISKKAQKNRSLLKKIMARGGFKNYKKEWWHFYLPNQKSKSSFNFDIK